MSCVSCHLSHVMCLVSRVTCHVSHVTCNVSHVTIFFLFLTKWLSLSVEGLISTGPTPSSFQFNPYFPILLFCQVVYKSFIQAVVQVNIFFFFFFLAIYLCVHDAHYIFFSTSGRFHVKGPRKKATKKSGIFLMKCER